MRIALLVGVGVVLAVVGHPVEHRALDRERARDREGVLQRGFRLEGAVGEHPVEAHGHAARGHQVHDGEDGQVGEVDPGAPEQDDGEQYPDEGHDHPEEVGEAFGAGHA